MVFFVEKRVLPGDFISTEEEFEAGENAFAAQGSILSDSVGTVIENRGQKTIGVLKEKNVAAVKPNDLVFGSVVSVRENSVHLSIFSEPDENERKVLLRTFAYLPVRLVSRHYVKNLHELFKIGDLVKAKIAAVFSYGIDVRTNEPELGVIRAFCSRCRQPLHLFDFQLKCLSCGNAEKRKLSKDYSLK